LVLRLLLLLQCCLLGSAYTTAQTAQHSTNAVQLVA
jgi:hypothetical protein